MRKLIYAINLALDGCCDHTKLAGTDEVHEYFAQLLQEADVLVYGRKTYQLMVPFWPDVAQNNSGPPKAINAFAKAFDSISKIVVFSKTLDKTEGKTTIVNANLENEILRLKQEPGKNILMGGVDIPSQLMKLGLVDEYCFVIQPIIAGEGRRLFDDVILPETLKLKLVDSKIFQSGFVALRYAK